MENSNSKLTIVDWSEFVNPNYIEIKVSNGKSLIIKPKKTSREKMYQAWLHLLDEKDRNPSVAATLNQVINQAAQELV